MRELKSGAQLASRYSLVRKLASGGMADTWLADDRMTGSAVALKILVDESIAADTLKREWQLSIRLMHAHIVRVFEFHEDDASFYSLQYVDGPDIGVLSGAPAEDVLAPIALIADAIRYAHGKDVVHRDIKAANVLLDHNGAPYLIDFGVASVASRDVGGGSLIAATPASLDGQPPSPADDVFALGGLVYELISGRSPYRSESTADDIRNRKPDPLTTSDGRPVSAELASLVSAMLAKDAAARPSAEEVVDAIRALGINPAPAPSRYVSEVAAPRDERIDTGEVVRPQRQKTAPPPVVESTGGGLSPRTVGISLAALILLLVGVVFLLPKTVTDPETDSQTPAVADVPAEEEPAETEEPEPEDTPQRDERVLEREAVDETLGRLLAKTRTLEARAVDRWGGLPWKQAGDAYAAGDEAYLDRDYNTAEEKYQEAIALVDPLLDRVDVVFEQTVSDAEAALENADSAEALRLYELAVAISPSHGPSRAGLARAKNLDTVLSLVDQGLEFERNLELDAAAQNFEQAIDLDPEWQPAIDGLERVRGTATRMSFDARMSEGLNALAVGDYLAARAAFRMAQELKPGSPEPADGLLQVEQGIRLDNITALEQGAANHEAGERWQEAIDDYERLLELDSALAFAQEGLTRAERMRALHDQLDGYIENPDSLSSPRTMQVATNLVVDITRMGDIGPRLADQRDELSRLLKRAATPLTVELVSDNLTDVSIYKVGKLGSFASTQLSLRPGTYVAVGSRPGYRDVRLEFRVAPEIDMQPVVVRCEERI